MVRITFPAVMQRHIAAPDMEADGKTVAEVLASAFRARPDLRSYILEDDGSLRHHMAMFVDGNQLVDRVALADRVRPDSRIDVLQALSGG